MDVPESPLPDQIAAVPTGHTVTEALDDYWRSKGVPPPSREKLANLPPWSDEDATAFEQSIHEAFESVDEAPRPSELSALSKELASLPLPRHTTRTSMDATIAPAETSPVKPPVTSTAASVLDTFRRMMGIIPLSEEEAAHLPPWTEEEAAAFERNINEAFEQIEDDHHPL